MYITSNQKIKIYKNNALAELCKSHKKITMNKDSLLKKVEEIKQRIEPHLKEPIRFIDVFKEDNEPKKILLDFFRMIGELHLLIMASELKELSHPKNKAIQQGMYPIGTLVSVRPCADEYKDKTYLGFYLGDVALGTSISTDGNNLQLNFAGYNPAIFVPEIQKIVYGCESWWSTIENEEQLKHITDDDISQVWYVKLMQGMLKNKEQKEKATQ